MAKIVLTSRIISDYDDHRETRYHFPKSRNNWAIAKQAKGDWLVYYEPFTTGLPRPRFGGLRAYFAVAQVSDFETDKLRPDHGYIHVENYLKFQRPVSYRHFFESALKRPDGSLNRNEFRRSIRPISDCEFESIRQAGYPRDMHDFRYGDVDDLSNHKLTLESLLERPVRNYLFRQRVLETYGNRCAISGLELYNKKGQPEVVATHIWPWAMGGPDVERNGLPLSGTITWMFRNGLITLTDDLQILRARELPKQLEALLPFNRAFGETIPKFRPHPTYLRFHRENIFERGPVGELAASVRLHEMATT